MSAYYNDTSSLQDLYDTIYELRILYDSMLNPFVLLTGHERYPRSPLNAKKTNSNDIREEKKDRVLSVPSVVQDLKDENLIEESGSRGIINSNNRNKTSHQPFNNNGAKAIILEKEVDGLFFHKVLSLPKIVEKLLGSHALDILRSMKEAGVLTEEDFREMTKRIREIENFSNDFELNITNIILIAFLLNSGSDLSFLINLLKEGIILHE